MTKPELSNRLEFKNAKFNAGIKAELFKFTPPPGVDMVERPRSNRRSK
jgi:outer membrane lipoprotein-sorting protein